MEEGFSKKQLEYIEFYTLCVSKMDKHEEYIRINHPEKEDSWFFFKSVFNRYQREVPEDIRKSFKRNRELEGFFKDLTEVEERLSICDSIGRNLLQGANP